MKRGLCFGFVVVLTMLVAGCTQESQARTPSPEPVATRTPPSVPTSVAILAPSRTPLVTPGHAPTLAPTPTSTVVPTATPTARPSPTASPTEAAIPSPSTTPTDTPVPSPTSTPVPTSTHTPTPTHTPTRVLTSTHTPTPTDTAIPVPTATHTPTPTHTATPTPIPEGVTISDSRAAIDFPESVEFRLLASSARPLERAELEFGTNHVYSCATESYSRVRLPIEPDSHLDLSWGWEMKKTGSIPPGTTIWWRWRLVDDEGQTFLSPREKLAWEDTRFSMGLLHPGQSHHPLV